MQQSLVVKGNFIQQFSKSFRTGAHDTKLSQPQICCVHVVDKSGGISPLIVLERCFLPLE